MYILTIGDAPSSLQATGEGISDLSPEVVLDDQATPCVVFPERGGVMAFITPAPANTLQPVCPKCEVRVCWGSGCQWVGGV